MEMEKKVTNELLTGGSWASRKLLSISNLKEGLKKRDFN